MQQLYFIFIVVFSITLASCRGGGNGGAGKSGQAAANNGQPDSYGEPISITQPPVEDIETGGSKLTWSFSDSSFNKFKIAFKEGSVAPVDCNSDTVITAELISSNSFRLSGLAPNTSYSIRVCAVDENDETTELASSTLEITTPTRKNQIIFPGQSTACALNEDTGKVKCWGLNGVGQLGNGQAVNYAQSIGEVQSLTDVIQISGGGSSACALVEGGTVKCWGNNGNRILGYATALGEDCRTGTYCSYIPKTVTNLSGVIQISLGTGHACALLSDNTVKCWGSNMYGELGRGTTNPSSYPDPTPTLVSGLSDVGQVIAKANFTCALIRSTGKIKCWGYNNESRLGDGTSTDSSTPVEVVNISNAVKIFGASGTGASICAETSSGEIYCWGSNTSGQLGLGSTTTVSTATLSPLFTDVKELFMGENSTCIIKNNDDFQCIGHNSNGQLGNNTTSNSYSSLVDVFNGGYPTGLGGGQYSNCAIYSSTDIKCWGLNHYGQLGDGTTTNRSSPVSVNGL